MSAGLIFKDALKEKMGREFRTTRPHRHYCQSWHPRQHKGFSHCLAQGEENGIMNHR